MNPQHYTIWTVSPHKYTHSQSFEHIATGLQEALQELGHDTNVVTDGRQCHRGKTIILAAHLLRPMDYLPDNFIIFNLEQAGSAWMGGYYLQLMRCATEMWDYSETNILALHEYGIHNVKHLEVGYSPCLTCIEPQDETLDVLFYGSLNPRRENIIHALEDAGLKVHHAFNIYGDELDILIASAKVVLNIHYYPAKIFEITRCGYLFANKKCVVSEIGVEDEPYRDTGGLTTYDRLTEYCLAFLRNDTLREQVAQRGYDIFTARKQVDFMRGLV